MGWISVGLGFNTSLSLITLVLCMVGVGFSVYCLSHALKLRVRLEVEATNGIKASVVRLHVVMDSFMLIMQGLLLVVAVLVMTLPDVPMQMYGNHEVGMWVVTVVLARKLIHVGMAVLMLVASVYKTRWLAQVG